ncbi:uncharacterized protein L201_004365 [Kwoniella dendrophila CBS 6074]|uniref:Amidase domain-containing protein n=1 Tax=Kwoniella dendrophila CBS 6074 TaxID=1295534 RepID=A0AAX4JVJ4_9TREE
MLKALFAAAAFLLTSEKSTATPMLSHDKEVIFEAPSNHNIEASSGPSTMIFPNQRFFYKLDNIDYFTPSDQPAHIINVQSNANFQEDFNPVMIIPIVKSKDGIFTVQHLQPLVEAYLSEDDVLTESHFETVLFHPESNVDDGLFIDLSSIVYLMKRFDTKAIFMDERFSTNLPSPGNGLPSVPISTIPAKSIEHGLAGPYLFQYIPNQSKLHFYPIYRLYPDYYKAFVNGIYPLNDGSGFYNTLDKLDSYAGERVGVKDIFDIKGVPTTAGSRLYTAWRGDVDKTASSVKKLEDEGAVIVGKAKTVAYANGGMTIEGTIDHLYPYSARGDQGQSCASSSSGPACALTAYDWLDFTVGSDTAGSIRRPAAVAGLYGNKPTQGIIGLDGVIPLLAWTDTAGILTRSPAKLVKILKTWYSDSPINRRHNHLPKTMLVPSDDFPDMPKDIKSLVEGFLKDVESTLGMKTRMVNQTAIHPHKHFKPGTDSRPYHNFFTATDFHETMWAWQWKHLIEPIVQDYEAKNEGRFPYVGFRYTKGWQEARKNPWKEEDFDLKREKLDRTADWFNNMIGRDEETCSKTLYIEPLDLDNSPIYRETKFNDISETLAPTRKNPLFAYAPASISGAPNYVIPIGQVPFKSLVSGQMEMHPILMSITAYPGCDFMILDFIDKLDKAGLIKEVKTGRTAF